MWIKIKYLDVNISHIYMWVINKRRRHTVDKRSKILLLVCIMMTVFGWKMWAIDLEEDVMDEVGAQRDMLAYVQSTFACRFGCDLQAGDYVRYEIADHHAEGVDPELCSLEATELLAGKIKLELPGEST